MPYFPSTIEELRASGYIWRGSARCKGIHCGKEIEWFTTPEGRMLPVDRETRRPHWESCPDAGTMRRKRETRRKTAKEEERKRLLREEPNRLGQGALFPA